MKLIKYLNEIGLFVNCKPVWEEMKRTGVVLYRGTKNFPGNIIKRNVRMDRTPLHTNKPLHELMDKLFKKAFGWAARSSALFATNNRNISSIFGDVYCVCLPVGKIEMLVNPKISDLYSNIGLYMFRSYPDIDYENFESWYNLLPIYLQKEIEHPQYDFGGKLAKIENRLATIEKLLNVVVHGYKFYNDFDILKENPSTETMLKCNEYYLIKESSNIWKEIYRESDKKDYEDTHIFYRKY